MRKKLLAIITAVAMVFAMAPSMAFAAEGDSAPDWEGGEVTVSDVGTVLKAKDGSTPFTKSLVKIPDGSNLDHGFTMSTTLDMSGMKDGEDAAFSFGINSKNDEYLDEAFAKFNCFNGIPIISQIGGNSSYDTDIPLTEISSEDKTFNLKARFSENKHGIMHVEFFVNGKMAREWESSAAYSLVKEPRYAWAFDCDLEGGIIVKENPSTKVLTHQDWAVKTDAKDATCTEDGNAEYWYCQYCEKYFKDADLTNETTKEESVIAAKGHSFADGKCTVCGFEEDTWAGSGTVDKVKDSYLLKPNDANEGPFTKKLVRIPLDSDLSHGFVMTSTLDMSNMKVGETASWNFGINDKNGNYLDEIAFIFMCDKDGEVFINQISGNEGYDSGNGVLDEKIIPADRIFKLYVKFSNDNGKTKIEVLVNDKLARTITPPEKYAPKSETIEKDYSYGSISGPRYAWLSYTTVADGVIVDENPATKVLTHTDYNAKVTAAKEATCTEEGNIEYWTCGFCENIFSDKEMTNEIKDADVILPALSHKATRVRATAATLDAAGNIEYWTCEACDKLYSDKAMTNEITEEQATINKIASVKLSTTAYEYNGYRKKPTVTTTDSKGNKLVEGEDYTVSYDSGRTAVGKYAVKIKFTGNYAGSRTLYFTIGPKNPTYVTPKLYGHDDVILYWADVKGETGYKIYYKKSTSKDYTYWMTAYNTTSSKHYLKKANLTDGAKYYFKVVPFKEVKGKRCYSSGKSYSVYTLKKIATPTVGKYSSTRVRVNWTNIPGESGYQISKSIYKTGTNIVYTYKTTTAKSKTISAVKGKTYYYKVRAYKTVDGKNIYGPWSYVKAYKLR